MPRLFNPLIILLGAIGAVALLAAACGGDDGYGGSSSSPTPASSAAAASPSAAATSGDVKVGDTAKGKVLTDAAGMTLYTFKSDAATPGKSACGGSCASTWPPLTTSAAPSSVSGATGTFATIGRDDGAKQLTYNGQPLYRFSGDKAAGNTNGDGFGGVWFVASVTQAASSASPAATTGVASGGDYGY